MTQKKLFIPLLLLAVLPLAAEEVKDTTVHYNNQTFVLSEDSAGTTRVTVYGKHSERLQPVREVTYANGNEIEKVFVGSPFSPMESLQRVALRPAFNSIYFGRHYFSQDLFGHKNADLHNRQSQSFELGATTYAFTWPLNKAKTLGVSAAVEVALVWHKFQKDQLLSTPGGSSHVTFTPVERGRSNTLTYGEIRMPVAFTATISEQYGGFLMNLGLAPVFRFTDNYHFKPARGSSTETVDESLGIRKFGLNLYLNMAFRYVTVTAQSGLIPTFKTADGAKAYSNNVTIGINFWDIFKKNYWEKSL